MQASGPAASAAAPAVIAARKEQNMTRIKVNWLLATAVLLVVCAVAALAPVALGGNWWGG